MVVREGDPELLCPLGRRARAFPRDEEGRYTGHYPATSQNAMTYPEALFSRRRLSAVPPDGLMVAEVLRRPRPASAVALSGSRATVFRGPRPLHLVGGATTVGSGARGEQDPTALSRRRVRRSQDMLPTASGSPVARSSSGCGRTPNLVIWGVRGAVRPSGYSAHHLSRRRCGGPGSWTAAMSAAGVTTRQQPDRPDRGAPMMLATLSHWRLQESCCARPVVVDARLPSRDPSPRPRRGGLT